MEKINFEAGTQVSPAKVTIDNVDHEVTPAEWEGNTPLSPFVLNKMQSNIENAISESGVIVSATEPTGANREKVWLQKSENMCNPNNKYIGAIATAEIGNMITYGTSEKTYTLKKCCKVQKGKAYAISWKPNTINTIGSRIIAVVNDNDITQYSTSYTNDSNSFIFTPTASGYLSISLDANATEVQVEGENATTYEPYVEPKMYVLNDNNVYEEFVLNEDKIVRNSNGTAIKFANGMMICTIDTLIGIYNDAMKTYVAGWTFPVAFVETPIYCGGTVFAGNSKAYSVTAVGLSNTSVNIHTKCLGTNGTVETCDRSANCIAIGRWK